MFTWLLIDIFLLTCQMYKSVELLTCQIYKSVELDDQLLFAWRLPRYVFCIFLLTCQIYKSFVFVFFCCHIRYTNQLSWAINHCSPGESAGQPHFYFFSLTSPLLLLFLPYFTFTFSPLFTWRKR